jgi:hypothetical protein
MAYDPRSERKRSNMGSILIVLAAACTIGYIWWTRAHPVNSNQGNDRSSSIAPSGDNPSSNTTAATPGDILFSYGRSTKAWVEQASKEFNDQHKGQWRIVPETKGGSRDAKNGILYGKAKPVIWSPADLYWTDKLNLDWRNPKVGNHKEDIVGDTQPILKSLFVLLMWEDRAKVFKAAMQQPRYQGRTWTLLSDIATRGWGSVGGPPGWGKLKLAQTEATESNSGQAALVLMLIDYRRSHPDATDSDPGFIRFMRSIEDRVGRFSDTTSKMVEAFVEGGKSGADMALCYESNAMQVVDKGETQLRVVYPDKTVSTNYPAAILTAEWVTPEKSQGAKAFVEYMRTPTVQKRALQLGFRPAIDNLRREVDNALVTGNREQAGFKLDVPTEPERVVSTKIIDGLIYQWYRAYGPK